MSKKDGRRPGFFFSWLRNITSFCFVLHFLFSCEVTNNFLDIFLWSQGCPLNRSSTVKANDTRKWVSEKQ